jgi:hypothetical protein
MNNVNPPCLINAQQLFSTELPTRLDLDAGPQPERLQTVIRRMRRDLEPCQSCPQQRDCPVMQSFNAMVAQAVREVNQ